VQFSTTISIWRCGRGLVQSPDRVDVTVFNEPFASTEAAASALKDFEIICAMRERTPFPRALFAALPKLKLLITSGMRNAAIDMEAAKDHIRWCCAARNGAAIPPRR
jgi:phosphoglycerate dehydrogenase-like enzyme